MTVSDAIEVRGASSADRDVAVRLAVAAFAVDPVFRWFFPDDESYPALATDMFGTLFDLRLAGGMVHVSDPVRSVAAWEPPGGPSVPREEQDRRWAEVASSQGALTRSRMATYDELVEGRKPTQPHWYLGVLAVDPAFQRRGLGPVTAAAGLAVADAAGLPAVLETASAANVRVYGRLGFETHAEVDLPGSGPHVWVLHRPVGPRPGHGPSTV